MFSAHRRAEMEGASRAFRPFLYSPRKLTSWYYGDRANQDHRENKKINSTHRGGTSSQDRDGPKATTGTRHTEVTSSRWKMSTRDTCTHRTVKKKTVFIHRRGRDAGGSQSNEADTSNEFPSFEKPADQVESEQGTDSEAANIC